MVECDEAEREREYLFQSPVLDPEHSAEIGCRGIGVFFFVDLYHH